MNLIKNNGIQPTNYSAILIQSVVLFLCLIIPSLSYGVSLKWTPTLKPYFGLEYYQRSLAFADGLGKGTFAKRLPQGNFVLGLKINDYLGVEVGYLFSQTSTRTTLTNQGSSLFLGNLRTAGQFLVSENKINLTGPRLAIMGNVPIGTSGFYGVGSVGIALITLKATVRPLATQTFFYITPTQVESLTRSFSAKKVVAQFMAGLGYQLSEKSEIRVMMGYETTSQLKNIAPKQPSPLRISVKNNVLASIGLTFKL